MTLITQEFKDEMLQMYIQKKLTDEELFNKGLKYCPSHETLHELSEFGVDGITTTWKKLVFKNSSDKINPCAYTFWTIERMNEALKRHDIFVNKSERYCDPRAQLLYGESWEAVKPHVLRTLDWSLSAVESLQPLYDELDNTYKNTAKKWDSNTAVRLENDRLILSPLDKLEESKSLKKLRKKVQSLILHTDLPELVLELNSYM